MFDPLLDMIVTTVEPKESDPKVVVRISTSYWSDNNGLYSKKSIKYLHRQCRNHNFLAEDVWSCDAYDVFPLFRDLDNKEDGVYEVVFVTTGVDWETGGVDEWEYSLVKLS